MNRLSWGSGPVHLDEWCHSDVGQWFPTQEHVGRIEDGLPWEPGTFDLVVSHHALQMICYGDLVPTLRELRRVTDHAGYLRMSVPDVAAAFDAWATGNAKWFPIPDTLEPTIGGKLCVYVTQASATRSVFTAGFLCELLGLAGWSDVRLTRAGRSRIPAELEPCVLDSRPDESIYVEAQP